MKTRLLLSLAALVFAIAAVSCGGDDKDPTGPGHSGNDPYYLRGTINGTAWSVPALAIGVTHAAPGQYILIGTGTDNYRLAMDLSNITGTGTFPLGVSALVRGGTVTLSQQPTTWTAPLSGSTGSITFTSLSDTLMVGTFNFTANEVGGVSTRTLSGGEFRLRVTTLGVVGPVPDTNWSEVRGTINGGAWNAAHIAPTYINNTLTVSASNDTRVVTLVFNEVNGPGEYPISSEIPTRIATAMGDGANQNVCCWGNVGFGTGSLTIDSITASRIVGHFNASLQAVPGTAATGTTEVSFDTFIIRRITTP